MYQDENGNPVTPSTLFGFNVHNHYFQELCDTVPGLSDDTRRSLMRFSSLPHKQLIGVVDGLNDSLSLWRDELFDNATSATDIDFVNLRRRPMTIYFQFDFPEYKRFAPFIRILYEFIIDSLMEEEPGLDEPYRVLLAMDEFANLGRLNKFESTLSLIRSYNIHVLAICQGYAQVKAVYNEVAESMMALFKKQLFSVCNDELTAKAISFRSGTKTSKTHSYRSGGLFGKLDTTNVNESFASEKLIKDYEAFVFDKEKLLLFAQGMRPAVIKKIRYWKWKHFNKKVEYSLKNPFKVDEKKGVDYSAFSKYPCVFIVAQENSQKDKKSAKANKVPAMYDLSEYQDIIDNTPIEQR